MRIIWFIAAFVFALFLILFLVRVIKKERRMGDVADSIARQVFNFKEFLKMAYPAAVIYALLYLVFVILCRFEVFGVVDQDMNAATWMPGLLALYLAIWLLLHIIDMDCRSRNSPFAAFLKTINTNTGVHIWNYVLLVISIIVIILSLIIIASSNAYYVCGPLFLVVAFSILLNIFFGSDADWRVKSPSEVKWASDETEAGKVIIKAALQEGPDGGVPHPANPKKKTPVERIFKWDLKQKWGITTDSGDDAKVTLYKEDWDDPDQDMRKKNPFYGEGGDGKMNWETAQQDIKKSASVVMQGPDENGENSEKIALQSIVSSAVAVASKYNLADYEVPELLLSLCQSAIAYKTDPESSPINQFNVIDDHGTAHLEYFRFAAETLYDKEGDCDCKSVLACRLLTTLGVDAKLVVIKKKGERSASHAAVLFKDEFNRFTKCRKYPEYAYCDATGEGWKIGKIPEELDEDSIEIIA